MTKIIELNPSNSDTLSRYYQVFDGPSEMSEIAYRHAHLEPPMGATIFAAEIDGRCASAVSFIAHSVCQNGDIGLAYQACNVFTHPSYRGKGLFPKIVRHAENVLSDRGAKFIFGFPNEMAAPIWEKKLGFTASKTTPVINLSFAKFPKLMDPRTFLEESSSANRVLFDVREVAEWKKKIHADIVEADFMTNYIFGRKLVRRFKGLSVNVFAVGGYEVNKPHIFEALLRKAAKRAGCHICRISVNSGSALFHASRIKRSDNLTEPLIFKGLNATISADQIEIAGGVKDVY